MVSSLEKRTLTKNSSELNTAQAKDELNEGVSDYRQGTHHDDFTQEELRKPLKRQKTLMRNKESFQKISMTKNSLYNYINYALISDKGFSFSFI